MSQENHCSFLSESGHIVDLSLIPSNLQKIAIDYTTDLQYELSFCQVTSSCNNTDTDPKHAVNKISAVRLENGKCTRLLP